MMSIRSLADFNWNSLGGVVTVGAITVTAQATSSGLTRRQGNGDFYLATSGDLQMATSGDFLMAMDNELRSGRPDLDCEPVRARGIRRNLQLDETGGVSVTELVGEFRN